MLNMVVNWLAQELWQFVAVKNVLHIQEFTSRDLAVTNSGNLFFFFVDSHLSVVSGQEGEESLYSWKLEQSWDLHHEYFLVLDVIELEDLGHYLLDSLVGVELSCNPETGGEVEVHLDEQVVLAEVNFEVVFDQALLAVANFFDQRSYDLLILFWILLQSLSDFSWEAKAQIVNAFSLKHLLCLVELLSHQSLEVIIQDVVLELCQLHGEKLLDDLVVHVIALAVLEVVTHVDSLLKLRADHQNVVLVSILGCKELLMAVLDGLVLVLVELVNPLIAHSDNLKRVIINSLPEDKLTASNFLLADRPVKRDPWNDEEIIEGPLSSLGGGLGY